MLNRYAVKLVKENRCRYAPQPLSEPQSVAEVVRKLIGDSQRKN